jgi:hypothetical protein
MWETIKRYVKYFWAVAVYNIKKLFTKKASV